MYSQILYFIVALLIFSIQQPGPKAFLPPFETLFLGGVTLLAYVLVCRTAFRRLRLSLTEELPQSILALRYHRTQSTLSIMALGALAIYVYVFNIKFYLQRLPGGDRWLTMLELIGLGIFIFHLCVIWFYGHPIYQRIHRSLLTRLAFIKGHLSFISALLIPWLLISFLSDLLQSIKGETFLHTESGQLLLSGLLLLSFLLFAPPLVVNLWGCKTIERGLVRAELEDFCRVNRFRVADFRLWPLFGGEMLTAGIIGILPGLRYILITRSLLTILETDELQAVLAHEMGHVRRYHMIFYLFFFAAFMALTLAFNDDLFLLLLGQTGIMQMFLTQGAIHHITLLSALYSLPLVLLLVIYFRYIFGFFMRNSERQADLYALQLIGHPHSLISSLKKIAFYSGRIENLPSWHHFSIRQRIDFLARCYEDRLLIWKHNRKLYGSAVLFFLAVIFFCFVGFQLGSTDFYKHWRLEAGIAITERQLRENPQNPILLAHYGGALFELGRTGEAESAWKKALEMTPEDAALLNNLAWLYATSPAPLFNPPKALELAIRAAELDPAPHVLDTLAEAHFVNSQHEEALKAIEGALEKEPKNPDYYLRQRRKFEEALAGQKARQK